MADTNVEVKLKGVRMSFADLFVPQEKKDDNNVPNGKYGYKANFLLDKDKDAAQIETVKKAMVTALRASGKTGKDGKPVSISLDRRCLQDGEPKDPDTGEARAKWDGYENQMFVSAGVSVKSKDAPNPAALIGPRRTAKDSKGKPIFPRVKDSDGLLYSGAYVNAIIRVYFLDGAGKYPDRIMASLEGVQFKEHGERFGGGAPLDVESAFDEEDGDDAFDDDEGSSDDDDLDDMI